MNEKELGEVISIYESTDENTAEVSYICLVRFNHRPNLKDWEQYH